MSSTHTHNTVQHPGCRRTPKILCFRVVQVQTVKFFLFGISVTGDPGTFTGQLWGLRGGRACTAPAQPTRADLSTLQGRGKGWWEKWALGLQRLEHFLSPVFPKSTVIFFHGLKLWIRVCIFLLFDCREKQTQFRQLSLCQQRGTMNK